MSSPWRRENQKDPDAGKDPGLGASGQETSDQGASDQGASEEETRHLATRASRIAAVWAGSGPEPYGQRFTEMAYRNIP